MIGDISAVSWGPSRIDIFGRGMDNAVWTKFWNGSKWSNWASLGGKTPDSPTAVSWGPNRIDIFVRGLDNVVYQQYFNGTAWSGGWGSLGGETVEEVVAVSSGPERLELFVRDFKNGIQFRSFNRQARWSGWSREADAGSTVSKPAAVGFGGNKVVLARQSQDNKLYRKVWNGSSWGVWEKFGDKAITGSPVLHVKGGDKAPAIVVLGDASLAIFA